MLHIVFDYQKCVRWNHLNQSWYVRSPQNKNDIFMGDVHRMRRGTKVNRIAYRV